MKFLRGNLRPLAWLALWVMCGLALTPTVSRSLSFLHGEPAGEHPMAHAMARMVASPERDASESPTGHAGYVGHAELHEAVHCGLPAAPQQPQHDHLDHCAMCGIAATAWALAPAAVQPAVVALADASPLPKPALTAPHGLLPWAVAQPRGPPRSSLT